MCFFNFSYNRTRIINHINGSAYGFIDIQEDLLDDYYEVANGPAKLVLVGELDGPTLPEKWKGTYNIRTQIPFVIRKNQKSKEYHAQAQYKMLENFDNPLQRVNHNNVNYDHLLKFISTD